MSENNKKQVSELDRNFDDIIQEIEKEYEKEHEVFNKKKTSVQQDSMNLFQEITFKRCEKESEELSKYIIKENSEDGNILGKILEGKEKEFRESYQKFLECSLPINLIFQVFVKNFEISSFFPVETLGKCIKNARENYLQNKDKEEAKIYASNCYNFVYEYNTSASNSIDEQLYKTLKEEFKNLDSNLL